MIARMPERPVVLEMQHITKRFPGIIANDDVSFDLREGEVHALLGENGAGKSTLMNILYGLYHPDEGEIRIKGKPVQLGSPRAAIDAGVGMVHQHFMLIPVMTVAENIVLASEPVRDGVLLDLRAAEQRVARAVGALRARGGPSLAHRGHHRRAAAARRDPEGALPQRGHSRAGRADGSAHPAGGARAVRDRARPHRAGDVRHLHQPQAERGRRDRRPHHRAAPGQARRDPAGRGRHGGEPRPADGRPRRPAPRRQDRGHAGRDAARRRGPPGLRRPRDREGARRLVRGARRRDRRHRGDRRQRPDRADRRDDRAAARRRWQRWSSTDRTSRTSASRSTSTRVSGTSRRTASDAVSCSSSRSRRTSRSTTTAASRTRGSAGSLRPA